MAALRARRPRGRRDLRAALDWVNAPAPESPEALRTAHRIARRLLQPEQIACYGCFLWAALILLSEPVDRESTDRPFNKTPDAS